jgi:hypothetical protein
MSMHLALFTLALQLGFSATPARPAQGVAPRHAADSLRDLKRARSAQASFERARRYNLAERGGSPGRCDVNLGRICWWYDEVPVKLPPEPRQLSRRREDLLFTLDSLNALHPGDEWIAGMRVHYRIEAGRAIEADSVARSCRATAWWCLALTGYAEHVLGRAAAAESAFAGAVARMPEPERCGWREISVLLPSRTRHWYETLSCDARLPVEERYWLLSRPRFSQPANEWRTEYYVRRVQARLAEHAVWPLGLTWGRDRAELLLRYGWPVGWSRLQQADPRLGAEPSVVEHEAVPSFAFAPEEALLDTSATATDDAWDLRAKLAESRYAPRLVARVSPLSLQLARFRRGDSTLLVAAYAAADDSLGQGSRSTIGATLDDGTTVADSAGERTGHATLMLASAPRLAGIDVADTTTRTLARARALYSVPPRSNALALSDLLLYRPGESPPESLDSAIVVAVAGDTVARTRPVGIYWETYGVADAGEAFDVAVTVERIDRSWLRGARQRIGLADKDSPLRLKWNDARPPRAGAAVSRAISLDLANLEPGKYRVTVSLERPGGESTSSARVIQLRER